MRISRLLFRLVMTSALAVTAISCGDESSDPSVVDVSELLGPGDLQIVDNGDGKVTLFWDTSNPEEDFEGYNIYGGKITSEDLESFGVTAGSSLQLLSQTGEPVESAKSLLQAMDYDSSNEKALPGAPTRTEEEEDEDDKPKFNFLPIHKQDSEGKAVVPTCQPAKTNDTAAIDCTAVESEDARKDSDDVQSFGVNKFEISGLLAGESYCFVVVSVQDEGEEISQSSSSVECVIPKIKDEWAGITLTSEGNKFGFDLKKYASECDLNNDTACKDEKSYFKTRSAALKFSDTEDAAAYAVHFESYGDDSAYIVGGKHVAIKDVGYYTDLSQVPFEEISKVSFPSNYSADKSDTSKNALLGSNYTRPFASVILKDNHVYLIAVGDQDGDYPTTFTYHWLHTSGGGSEITKSSAFTPTFLISKTTDSL